MDRPDRRGRRRPRCGWQADGRRNRPPKLVKGDQARRGRGRPRRGDLAAVGVLVGFAGTRSIVLVALAIAGVIVTVIGLWVALSHRGVVRYLGLALALAAVVTVAVLEIRDSLLWVVLVALALAGLGYA